MSKINDFEDLEELKQTEVKHDLKIKIKKEVEDKIIWLTHNYSEEISAFLTGEIKNGEIIIDGLLFPHQDVSGGSVEVEPKDLIKLRKEYGDECLRIIGHWHSHNTMNAFWSVTDEEFINSYSITKDISIFFVSSTLSRCKVMLVMNKPFEIRLDNLEYETIWDSENFENDLKKIIKDKIVKKVYPTQIIYGYNDNDYNYTRSQPINDNKTEELKIKINEAICYNADSGNLLIKDLDLLQSNTLSKDTKRYNPKIEKLSQDEFTILYKVKNKYKAVNLIKEIKTYLEELFEEELNLRDYTGIPDY